MPRGSRMAIGVLLLAALVCVALGVLLDRDPPPGPVPLSPADRVREELRQTISLDVTGKQFDQVLAELAERHGLRIELDGAAFKGLPVTMRLRDVQLANALDLLLMQAHWPDKDEGLQIAPDGSLSGSIRVRIGVSQVIGDEHRLAYSLVNDTLHITDREAAESFVVTKIYPIADLLDGPTDFNEESVAELVRACVPTLPTTDEVQGIVALPGALSVSRPELAHDEISDLLDEIRRVADPTRPRPVRVGSTAVAAIEHALASRADFAYTEVPLDKVLNDLSRRFGINIVLDAPGLYNALVDARKTRVSLQLSRATLASALRGLLDEHNLAFSVEHECVLVTDNYHVIERWAVYPVRDLLERQPPDANELLLETAAKFAFANADWIHSGPRDWPIPVPDGFALFARPEAHDSFSRFLQHLRRALDPLVTDHEPFDFAASELLLFRALERKVSLEANETRLEDVLATLSGQVGVRLVPSLKKLEEADVSLDTPVTKTLRDQPLRRALRAVLDDVGLSYIVRDEAILITSQDEQDNHLMTGIYRLGQLTSPALGVEPKRLRNIILNYIHPDSWSDAGGPGRAESFGDVLLIRATRQTHDECQELLGALARCGDAGHRGDLILWETAADRRVREMLCQNVTLDSATGTAEDLVKAIGHALGDSPPHPRLPLDEEAIEAGGGSPPLRHPTPMRQVAVRLRTQPVGDALTTICRQLRHGWFVGAPVDLEWVAARGGVDLVARDKATEASALTTRLFHLDAARFGTVLTPDRLRDLIVRHAPSARNIDDRHYLDDHLSRADAVPGGVLVAAHQPEERQVRCFVDQLRHVLDEARELPLESQVPPHHAALEGALIRTARLECKDAYLESVLQLLQSQHGVKFVADEVHLHRRSGAPGVSTYDQRVTFRAADVSLAELLDQVLAPLEIAWDHHDGRIVLARHPVVYPGAGLDAFVSDARPLLAALKNAPWIADGEATAADFLRHAVDPTGPEHYRRHSRQTSTPSGFARSGERLKDFTLVGPALVATHSWRDHLGTGRLLAGAEGLGQWLTQVTALRADPTEEALASGLRHPVETVRAFAAYWLGMRRAISAGAVEALAAACESPNQSVRLCAIFALSRVPGDSPLVGRTVLRAIDKCLGGSNVAIRRCAVAALGRLGPAAAPSVETLRPCLQTHDTELRDGAVLALGQIGKAGLPLLLEFLASRGSITRASAQAVVAMDQQGIDALSPMLDIITNDQRNESARNTAAYEWFQFLAETGPDGTRLLMRVATATKRGIGLRRAAISALLVARGAGAVDEALLEFLEDLHRNDPDVPIREAAGSTLYWLAPERAQKLGIHPPVG